MKVDMRISDLNACISDVPEALIAVSSELSPKFPNVINDERRIANGNACGTSISPIYQKNCAIISIEEECELACNEYI